VKEIKTLHTRRKKQQGDIILDSVGLGIDLCDSDQEDKNRKKQSHVIVSIDTTDVGGMCRSLIIPSLIEKNFELPPNPEACC
jgi:hypothetical protein